MSSKVSIISQAFTLLGKGNVTDLESTAQTQAASVLYDRVYPTLLCITDWHFARVLGEELNLVNDDTEINEWEYAYQLPVSMLLLYRLRPNVRFLIAKDKLYTNYKNTASGLKIDYVEKVTENKLPIYFQSALVYRMTSEIAMPITQNQTLTQFWGKEASASLSLAMALDAQSNPTPFIQHNPLWSAHFA